VGTDISATNSRRTKAKVNSECMDINVYLERINYTDALEPTLQTLQNIHQQHLLNIPYENLDIHLGRKLELNPAHIFEKLVTQKRGGWCYEMNTIFAWALRELGFEVTLLSGAVNRDTVGVEADGNHLVLLVKLEQPYIADVGFGDLPEVLPLQEGSYQKDFMTVRLTKDGDWWRLHNHDYGGAKRFDFTLHPQQLSDFAEQCHRQQTSPGSGFVKTTVCQIFTGDGFVTLRGAVLQTVTKNGVVKRVLDSEKEYDKVLRETFGLELPTGELYAKVWQRHLDWLMSHPKG
jgi:N-hydroxyarylamine O-acetyltransferase